MSNSFEALIAQKLGTTLTKDKPEICTTIYKVYWEISKPPDRYTNNMSLGKSFVVSNSRSFASKEKAEKLKSEIDAAFVVLRIGFQATTHCEIVEEWYE